MGGKWRLGGQQVDRAAEGRDGEAELTREQAGGLAAHRERDLDRISELPLGLELRFGRLEVHLVG